MAAGLRRQCAQVRRLPSVNKINILVKIAVGIINAQVSNDNQQTPPYAYPSLFLLFYSELKTCVFRWTDLMAIVRLLDLFAHRFSADIGRCHVLVNFWGQTTTQDISVFPF